MSLEIRAGIASRAAAFKDKMTDFKSRDHAIKKKVGLSAVLGGAVLSVNMLGLPFLAHTEVGWLNSLASGDLNNGWMLGAGYGASITASLVNLNQIRRLLQNEQIETSQDLPATLTYHGLGKVDSLKEKRKGRSIAALSFPIAYTIASTVPKDSLFQSVIVSSGGVQELAALKLLEAIFIFAQAGIAEFALRTVGRKKETKNKVEELPVFESGEKGLPAAADIVFAPAKIEK